MSHNINKGFSSIMSDFKFELCGEKRKKINSISKAGRKTVGSQELKCFCWTHFHLESHFINSTVNTFPSVPCGSC